MNSQTIIVAGVDISKAKLDVDLANTNQPQQFNNDEKGIAKLIAWIRKNKVQQVVMEATGGLERKLASILAAKQIPFHIANPRQVRDFARAAGKLAKTDRIDAKVIAQFGEKFQLPQTVLPSKIRQKLIAAITRYEQLVQMRIAESNRLDRIEDEVIRALTEQMIENIKQQIERVMVIVKQLISEEEQLKRDVEILESVPGIAILTASRLVALLPELGQRNRKQIARLIGVAPINRDSGTMRGKRTTGGGRARVRKQLYMATLVAIQHNPLIQQTYQHLVKRGKPKMVAIIAAMRKLVIILNVMIREQKTWQEVTNYA